jgi:hypothetical protein
VNAAAMGGATRMSGRLRITTAMVATGSAQPSAIVTAGWPGTM